MNKTVTVSKISINRIHVGILIFGLLILISLIRWQGIDASRMLSYAKQHSSTFEINSIRGTIYSKDGTTLSFTEPRFDIYVWYKDLEYFERLGLQTREEFLNKVAPIIDTTPELLEEKIEDNVDKGILWFQVAKSIPDNKWRALQELKTDKYQSKLSGIADVNVSKRIYPEGRLASHVVGITNKVNEKMIGVSGVEGAFNEILNPIKGIIIQENNAKGEAIATALTATIEPKNGSSVYTSIDKKLQQTVERMLKEGVEKYAAKSGSVVIMDPKTGQLMALANYPDYDPNLREEKEPETYGNSAISAPYEMGSIGKALTIAAAVDLDRIDENTVILPNGHQGCEKFTDELGPLCTWDKLPQGPMPLKDCFAASDNICLFHIARDHLSKDEFHDYLHSFGIGQSSGIDTDLSGESYGPLRSVQDWTIGDVAAMSYGHGYSVNVIQVATSVGTIANNGVRMKPYVVTKVVDSDGKVNEYNPVIVETVLKKDTVDQMIKMMNYNFEKSISEWWYYDLLNYNIGVKSGTALIADETGYSDDIYASFVGFDASELRTFIMVVKLERPTQPSSLSYYNVRPLWLDIFSEVKDIIGVPRK